VKKIQGDQCDEKLQGSIVPPKSLVSCNIYEHVTPDGKPARSSPALLVAAIAILVFGAVMAVILLLWAKNDRYLFILF
jgi:hypothetical protein